MNGKYLLDTNVLIRLLSGTPEITMISRANPVICISIITEIELLSYPKLTPAEDRAIRNMLSQINIIMLDASIKEKTIQLRRNYSLKTPDAIIAATAICQNATFVTDDKVFSRIKVVTVEKLQTFLNK